MGLPKQEKLPNDVDLCYVAGANLHPHGFVELVDSLGVGRLGNAPLLVIVVEQARASSSKTDHGCYVFGNVIKLVPRSIIKGDLGCRCPACGDLACDPFSRRCLFTVRAASSSALLSLALRSSAMSLMCSYRHGLGRRVSLGFRNGASARFAEKMARLGGVRLASCWLGKGSRGRSGRLP
jgi:hypothetical protein